MQNLPSAPGPLMDAAIARTLWRALVIHEAEADASYLMGEDGGRVELPGYSTDPDAAQRVVALMQSKGWTLSLKHEGGPGGPHFVALFGRLGDGRTYRYVRAESMALAVCLAALWAHSGFNVEREFDERSDLL